MPPDLRGKIALVTGVGRVGQIGHAVARGFGRAGAQLVIADVNAAGLADRAKEFTAEGFAVQAAAGDLTTPDAARRAVALARERFGGLDVVVNVAGGLVNYGPVLDLKPERLELELAINIKTTFYVSQAAIPALRDRGGGAIVNFASAAVLKPQSQMAAYTAATSSSSSTQRTLAPCICARLSAVFMVPGATAFTRIRSSRSSFANARVSPATADLAAV